METCVRTEEYSPAGRAKIVMTCARCGDAIHMARRSEYVDPWRVRLEWECDACGHHFSTVAHSRET
jgi:hypothetical protein